MMPLYSIGTWDIDAQAYTPRAGLSVPSLNISLWTLKRAMRELKAFGYSCHYFRASDGSHESNDWSVLVERTDGESEESILKRWKR
jgi:hypothetical protein